MLGHVKEDHVMKKLLLSSAFFFLFPILATASLLEELESELPDNSWLTSFDLSHSLEKSGDDNCVETSCLSSGCVSSACTSSCDPRVPMMIGDGGLGVPTTLLFQFQNHLTKVSENNSVIPQDRVGMSWNILGDVRTRSGGFGTIPGAKETLHEYRFRYERTFNDARGSVDLIVPFNYTTNSQQLFTTDDAIPGLEKGTELGNIAANLKYVLYETDRLTFSSGLMVELPTQDDLEASANLEPIIPISIGIESTRDTWFYTPWLGFLYEINDKTNLQSFLSYRMNSNDNDVSANIGLDFIPLNINIPLGSSSTPDYFMWDTQISYRMYDNPHGKGITAVIPALELHYTSSRGTDPVGSFRSPLIPITIPPAIGSVDYLNMVLATNFELGQKASLGVGFGLPLRSNSGFSALQSGPTDRTFNWSLGLNFNYYFGQL